MLVGVLEFPYSYLKQITLITSNTFFVNTVTTYIYTYMNSILYEGVIMLHLCTYIYIDISIDVVITVTVEWRHHIKELHNYRMQLFNNYKVFTLRMSVFMCRIYIYSCKCIYYVQVCICAIVFTCNAIGHWQQRHTFEAKIKIVLGKEASWSIKVSQ